MNNQDYEQKKRECWEEFRIKNPAFNDMLGRKIFNQIYDRAYALGQEKETITQEEIEKASVGYAAKTAKQYEVCNSEFVQEIMAAFEQGANYALGQENEAKPNNTIKARRKSDGEIIEVEEWRGASDVIYTSPDMNHFYQASELDFNVDADTVIQGWVARDKRKNYLNLHLEKPYRTESGYQTDDKSDLWESNWSTFLELDSKLFPDLTWESDPEPVEIIIKRKKK